MRHDPGAVTFLLVNQTLVQATPLFFVGSAEVEVFLIAVAINQKLLEHKIERAEVAALAICRDVLGVGYMLRLVNDNASYHGVLVVSGEQFDVVRKTRAQQLDFWQGVNRSRAISF